MNYNLPSIKNYDFSGKSVFLRLDLDVPLCKDEVEDDTRLLAGIPTLKYLLEQNAKVIIGGHLDRPGGVYRKEDSLEPVARWLSEKLKVQSEKLKVEETKIGDFKGWQISENLILLENLRFNKREEENDPEFAGKLASLADVFVNDAFAMCHRDHASVTGIAKLLPHFAGFHLQKEVRELGALLDNPKRPFVVVIGGKKIETKLPLVEKMHSLADYVLVGGLIAQEQSAFVKIQHEKITGKKSALLIADCIDNGRDISQKDSEKFLEIINRGKTVCWNGPMGFIDLKCNIKDGKIEDGEWEKGTRAIAEGIAKSDAYKVVGGGDTVEYLQKLKLKDRFNFVSTGGGAMLSFLSGEKLPGLEALK